MLCNKSPQTQGITTAIISSLRGLQVNRGNSAPPPSICPLWGLGPRGSSNQGKLSLGDGRRTEGQVEICSFLWPKLRTATLSSLSLLSFVIGQSQSHDQPQGLWHGDICSASVMRWQGCGCVTAAVWSEELQPIRATMKHTHTQLQPVTVPTHQVSL